MFEDKQSNEIRWASLDVYQLPEVPGYQIASFTQRVLGFMLDVLIVIGGLVAGTVVGNLLLVLMTGGTSLSGDVEKFVLARTTAAVLGILVFVLVPLYNRAYLISKRGASLGQRATKLRTVTVSGQTLSSSRAALRMLLEVGFVCIPFLPLLDLLWPIVWFNPSPEKAQTLHDRIVGAYVIAELPTQ